MDIRMRTYKFRLNPSKEQVATIEKMLGLCRWLYNCMLEQRIFAYRRRGITLNYYNQVKEYPVLKKELPIYKEVHSQVLQEVGKRLQKAFDAFFRRIRNGEKPGFPRFQGKNRYDSLIYPQSGFSVEGKYLKLSKVGNIRIKLHRQIEGEIKTCIIKRKNGKYYACLTCEVVSQPLPLTNKQVGVDLGISYLATTSDGNHQKNHKYLHIFEQKIAKLQREASRKKKGSNRRKKATILLAKAHEKVSNQRKDTCHVVSKNLVKKYDLIVFEDLQIQKMVKNQTLAKSIHDASWGKLIQYTTYKAEYAGKKVELVDPHNTSQECSECGQIVKKKLSERTHRCSCGYTADRDINAARNILKKARGYIPQEYHQLELNLA